MTRGFSILAQNSTTVNYVECATALAKSIKKLMPNEKIALITSNDVESDSKNLFDHIVPLPYGDLAKASNWKLINDWQIYDASPFDQTIKLEADIYLPTKIDHWWDILNINDVVVCTTIRNFKQEISKSRAYRKFIDDNKLPDVYNAITYFKKSDFAEKFYNVVRNIFENWSHYKAILKCDPTEDATTDWVYALACHLLGVEKTTLPNDTISMVHMKRFINDLPTDDWTDTLIYEILPYCLRINTVPQLYPFHYNVKSFSKKILSINHAR